MTENNITRLWLSGDNTLKKVRRINGILVVEEVKRKSPNPIQQSEDRGKLVQFPDRNPKNPA